MYCTATIVDCIKRADGKYDIEWCVDHLKYPTLNEAVYGDDIVEEKMQPGHDTITVWVETEEDQD